MPAAGNGTALLIDPVFKLHDTGPGHPERPERYDAVTRAFDRAGLTQSLLHVATRPATEDEIALCHTRPYIQTVKRDIAAGARDLSTGDTTISPKSLEVALDAAGGLMNAVDLVFEKKAANAFCAVRPPGITPARTREWGSASSITSRSPRATPSAGTESNGSSSPIGTSTTATERRISSTPTARCFSSAPTSRPGIPAPVTPTKPARAKARAALLNCPFPAGAGRSEILGVFQERLLQAADQFKPDLVLTSAGFDSRFGDPLGRFTLSDQDFADLTARDARNRRQTRRRQVGFRARGRL